MEEIHSILDAIDRPGGKVLATLIDVEGSSYKKTGSSMLFFENGTRIGMLSAGCLEEDLSFKAAAILKKGTVEVVRYDMRDETDFFWGHGVGCNGILTIYLEVVDERLQADLLILKNMLKANISVWVLKKIGELGEYLFLPKEGKPFGWWDGEIPDIFDDAGSVFIQEQSIFRNLFHPKPRLILFGAGPDARPLAGFAAQTGFSVIVCDWREEYCRKEFFPEAEKRIVGFPREIIEKIKLLPTDFVVILSHHFIRDQESLMTLPANRMAYIGVLGPKERTKRLLGSEVIPEWIHSPVGLRIGAEGPEEIAISIMAELIEHWRKSVRKRAGSEW